MNSANLRVEALPEMVERLGMTRRHLPIRQRYPPSKRFDALWADASALILGAPKAGRRIFIHGKGGLGRTGTIAAILLVESGITPKRAIEKIRAARPNAIETAVQEWRVMFHKPHWAAETSPMATSELA